MTNSTAAEANPGRPLAGEGLSEEQIVCLIQAVANRRDEMRHLAASEEPGSPERAPFDRESNVAGDLHDLLAAATAVEVSQ